MCPIPLTLAFWNILLPMPYLGCPNLTAFRCGKRWLIWLPGTVSSAMLNGQSGLKVLGDLKKPLLNLHQNLLTYSIAACSVIVIPNYSTESMVKLIITNRSENWNFADKLRFLKFSN